MPWLCRFWRLFVVVAMVAFMWTVTEPEPGWVGIAGRVLHTVVVVGILLHCLRTNERSRL